METRQLHEIPVHILQEFIVILRANQNFEGEGKVREYQILKIDNLATIIYDNGKVCFIAQFVKDKDDNWFFQKTISIRETLNGVSTKKVMKELGLTVPEENNKTDK